MYPLFKDLDNSKVLIETRNVFARILYHATIIPVHSSPVNVENIWKFTENILAITLFSVVSNVVFTWMSWLVNRLMTVDCIDDEGLTQNAVARPSPLSAVQICVSAVCQFYNLQISLISSRGAVQVLGLGIFLNLFPTFIYCITRSNNIILWLNFWYLEIPMFRGPVAVFYVGSPGL